MSVFIQKSLVEFIAPIAISQRKVGIQGSWSNYKSEPEHVTKMSPNILFHLRLHTWEQKVKNHSSNACIDWQIERENATMQHYVILRFDNSLSCFKNSIENIKFKQYIDDILNSSTIIWSVFQSIEQSCRIQQAQPGEGSTLGDMGSDGRE